MVKNKAFDIKKLVHPLRHHLQNGDTQKNIVHDLGFVNPKPISTFLEGRGLNIFLVTDMKNLQATGQKLISKLYGLQVEYDGVY